MFCKKFMTIYSQKLHHAIDQIQFKLLPSQCLLCGKNTLTKENICTPCEKSLPTLPENCLQCGKFLTSNQTKHLRCYLRCGECSILSPPFDICHSLFPYQPPIPSLIAKLKFTQQLSYAKLFADLLYKKIINEWYVDSALPDLIIPVPLHSSRLVERGFNQALEIAKPLSKKLKIPLNFKGIERVKSTLPQSSLPSRHRIENMKNAFRSNQHYSKRSVAVIDDVMTTGHTLNEFCALLKNCGVGHLTIWCCARNG